MRAPTALAVVLLLATTALPAEASHPPLVGVVGAGVTVLGGVPTPTSIRFSSLCFGTVTVTLTFHKITGAETASFTGFLDLRDPHPIACMFEFPGLWTINDFQSYDRRLHLIGGSENVHVLGAASLSGVLDRAPATFVLAAA